MASTATVAAQFAHLPVAHASSNDYYGTDVAPSSPIEHFTMDSLGGTTWAPRPPQQSDGDGLCSVWPGYDPAEYTDRQGHVYAARTGGENGEVGGSCMPQNEMSSPLPSDQSESGSTYQPNGGGSPPSPGPRKQTWMPTFASCAGVTGTCNPDVSAYNLYPVADSSGSFLMNLWTDIGTSPWCSLQQNGCSGEAYLIWTNGVNGCCPGNRLAIWTADSFQTVCFGNQYGSPRECVPGGPFHDQWVMLSLYYDGATQDVYLYRDALQVGTPLNFPGSQWNQSAFAEIDEDDVGALDPEQLNVVSDAVWSYSEWVGANADAVTALCGAGNSLCSTGGGSGCNEAANNECTYLGNLFNATGTGETPQLLPPMPVQPQGSAVAADAYGGGSPSEPCSCDGASTAQASTADPVNTATGDLHETSTDLSLPGAGPPLTFTRTYDADAAQAEAAAGAMPPPLGYGWTANLLMSLFENTTTHTATVTEENGAQTTFTPYASGSSPAWCTSATNFCATAPRMAATLNQNADGTWTYVRATGGSTTFTFASTGALTQIADATGAMTGSVYVPSGQQPACPSGDTCTSWTSAVSGRELVLDSSPSGQLGRVFDPNSTLAATYAYSGTGCTSWSGGQHPDLCTATDPGNLKATFTYDAGNSTTSLDYDLLSETPPSASAATVNSYDSSGRVAQQTDPSGSVTTLSYAGSNASYSGGTTTVTTYPLGTGSGKPQDVTVDQYSSNVLIASTAGSGSSAASERVFNRDPVSLLPSAASDGDGHVSSTVYQTYNGAGGTPVSSANALNSMDGVGNVTQNAYNTFNQAWCTVDAADDASGARCPSTPPSAPPAPGASDPNAGMTISFYNGSDQLTATTDALGNTTTYAYTSGVSGVPNGVVYCSVDAASYQKSVTCPAYGATHVAGTTTTAFDAAGDRTATTDADGNTTTYAYADSNHPGLTSSQTDADGTTTAYVRNGAGQVTTQTVSFGSFSATTADAYDSVGRKYCEVAPNETALNVSCPSSPPSPPTPGNDPYLGATITNYDATGRVVQTTNPLGGITYTGYDAAGEAFCSVAPFEAAKGVTCPSTAPTSPPTVGNDPYLGATITTYDADGRAAQMTNPLGGITLTSYDGSGNVTQTTVESNNSTTAPNVVTGDVYDADNRVVSTTVDPGSSLAATTSISYDPNGKVYCEMSANAAAAGTAQCPIWQPAWIAAPPSPTSLYSSNPSPSQANQVTTSFYNADGTLLQTSNPDIETTVTVADPDLRSYCSADPTNTATWLAGHPSGTYPYLCPGSAPSSPPAQGSNPGYVTTIFDSAGRSLSSTDAVGDTTAYSYDPAGHRLTTTDPRGKVTTNCYYYENGAGACAQNAPAGGGSGDDRYSTTTPATSADPSGETTTATYYPGEQPRTSATPAGTMTDTYDGSGDLTAVSYSGTANGYAVPTNLSYTYNVDGSRATIGDATGTTTYAYDAAGDVTSQALAASGSSGLANATLSYAYFSTRSLQSMTYPAYTGHANPVVTYTYDASGAMISETDWLGNVVTFGHDASGNATTQDNAVSTGHPNGTSSSTSAYDAANQNASVVSTLAQTCGGNETLTQSFSGSGGTRNADGQVTQDSESYSGSCSGQGSYQRNYSYDLAGRVVYQGSAAQGANANNVAFDPSGDPTTISSHDASANFDTYTQAFDAAGEVTSQTPIAGSGGSTSTFGYDTLGDQTSLTSGSQTSSYGFDQAGHMVNYSAPGSASAAYLYNGDGLEAAAKPSGGTLWQPATSIDGSNSVASVSCPTSSFCAAVDGNGNVLTYNGRSWSSAQDIDGTNALDAVSCPTSSFCVAVDGNGNAFSYNGSSWSTAINVDSTHVLKSVSCPSSSFCAAVDSSGYATTYNGSAWSTARDIDGNHALHAVSCPTSSFCVAVDAKGNDLAYNGSSWSSATDIDSTRVLKSVSCPTVSFCAAVDTSGYALIYNGSSWSTATNIDGSHALDSVSCTGSAACDGVDSVGDVLSYNGSTWAAAQDIDGARVLNGVSCPTTAFCAAVDASGYAVVYAFSLAAWGAATSIDGSNSVASVACPSASFCAAVDAKGNALTYNGSSWSGAQDIDGSNALSGVSCPSSSFCVAVDGNGNAFIYNGSSWSSATNVDGTHVLKSVSCPSSSFCAAVDSAGYANTYNGSAWSTPRDIDGSNALHAVSCPTSSFCVAVDAKGNDLAYNGSSWSSATDIDSTRVLKSVSCPTASFCAAVDTSGYALTYHGSSWSMATNIDGSHALDSVSCTDSTACDAVDGVGDVLSYNGSTWSAAQDIDGARVLNGVSCATTGFCAAVDASGNELLDTQIAGSTSQVTWDTIGALSLIASDGANDYVYGPGTTPVEQVLLSTSLPMYMTFTQSDSSWLTTNSAGDETGFWRYDAFGTLAFGVPTSSFGYAGGYADSSSNLSDFRLRWYAPTSGGFTSRDPAFASTDQAYAYALGDPVNIADPTGLYPAPPGAYSDEGEGYYYLTLTYRPGDLSLTYKGQVPTPRYGKSVPYTATAYLNGKPVQSDEKQTDAYGASYLAGAIPCRPGHWQVRAQGRGIDLTSNNIIVNSCDDPEDNPAPQPQTDAPPWWALIFAGAFGLLTAPFQPGKFRTAADVCAAPEGFTYA